MSSFQFTKNKVTKNKAFTLIELLVAVFIFTLVVGLSSAVFISGIQLQRRALASQKLLDEVGYALEYMSRAIRMAKKERYCTDPADPATCYCLTGSGHGYNYEITREGKGLKFINYKNECQEFFWEAADNQLKESKDGGQAVAFTSAGFEVKSFNIQLSGESQEDNEQPRVTFFLEIKSKGLGGPEVQLQTTISQRNPDIQI